LGDSTKRGAFDDFQLVSDISCCPKGLVSRGFYCSKNDTPNVYQQILTLKKGRAGVIPRTSLQIASAASTDLIMHCDLLPSIL